MSLANRKCRKHRLAIPATVATVDTLSAASVASVAGILSWRNRAFSIPGRLSRICRFLKKGSNHDNAPTDGTSVAGEGVK